MYTIHATRKLLDRVRQPPVLPVTHPTTALGNWYATAIFSKPQVALLVNEATLLPVVMPLALAARFPHALAEVLTRLGINPAFIKTETGPLPARPTPRQPTAAPGGP